VSYPNIIGQNNDKIKLFVVLKRYFHISIIKTDLIQLNFLSKNCGDEYYFNADKNPLTMARTTAASSAVPNPSILNPGTILLVIRSNTAFITNVNNPSVRILIGRVRMTSIGLMIAVRIPHTTATTKSVCHPVIVIPGIIYVVI
jgi:hypothetical protein